MEVIYDLSVQCHAKIHLAVPGAQNKKSRTDQRTQTDLHTFPAGETDYLKLDFKLTSQEGLDQDITTIALSAEASSNSLGARYKTVTASTYHQSGAIAHTCAHAGFASTATLGGQPSFARAWSGPTRHST